LSFHADVRKAADHAASTTCRQVETKIRSVLNRTEIACRNEAIWSRVALMRDRGRRPTVEEVANGSLLQPLDEEEVTRLRRTIVAKPLSFAAKALNGREDGRFEEDAREAWRPLLATLFEAFQLRANPFAMAKEDSNDEQKEEGVFVLNEEKGSLAILITFKASRKDMNFYRVELLQHASQTDELRRQSSRLLAEVMATLNFYCLREVVDEEEEEAAEEEPVLDA